MERREAPRSTAALTLRVRTFVGRVIGVAGLGFYNWWIGVVVAGGILASPNELFSDLEATGRPHADLLGTLDVVAGLLMLSALLLRGRYGPEGARAEWWLLVAFAAAAAVGGLFPYLCPEGASAACRTAEWHFQLPWRHYVHVLSGVVEFGCVSVATLVAWRRTRGRRDLVGRTVRGVGVALLAAYPLIAVAYLTDRLGALVEPLFFVSFSAMVAAELFEPAGPVRNTPPEVSRRT